MHLSMNIEWCQKHLKWMPKQSTQALKKAALIFFLSNILTDGIHLTSFLIAKCRIIRFLREIKVFTELLLCNYITYNSEWMSTLCISKNTIFTSIKPLKQLNCCLGTAVLYSSLPEGEWWRIWWISLWLTVQDYNGFQQCSKCNNANVEDGSLTLYILANVSLLRAYQVWSKLNTDVASKYFVGSDS